ncbi:MAG TPA: helix-turn-helix domain-containing protein [Dehalococcoidia bacterium]|nr:helix-turn-helix domain-containing protein [Dehalococcoidia bacterium]
MTKNGFSNGDLSPGHERGSVSAARWLPEIVKHMSLTLGGLVLRLHQEGLPVPREVDELTAFLVRLARGRLDPSVPAGELGPAHAIRVPDRLLVTKGEAAERLGVSVRTIERLVATGRLRQVHVERLARFRVSDLEAYVNSLAEDAAPDSDEGLGRQ